MSETILVTGGAGFLGSLEHVCIEIQRELLPSWHALLKVSRA